MTACKSVANVILFTRGTKGDLFPFLALGKGFKDRGCQVSLLSNYCYAAYAQQECLDFAALDDQESFDHLNNMPEYHSKLSAKLRLSRDFLVPSLEKEVQIIGRKISGARDVLIAHSNDLLSPLLAAEKFKVPLYLCMFAPSYIHALDLVEAVLKSLATDVNRVRQRLGLAHIHDWKAWLHGFEKCFALWPAWFSDDGQKSIADLEYVGFMPGDGGDRTPLPEEMKTFLGKREKTILITHGTSLPFNDQYFRLAIASCQETDCKLVVTTPFPELLPDELPDNVHWVKFCSFRELLPRVNLIVHHGGIGTTHESIAAGVPQLIVGQGFDRQHNGRIVESLGVGDWIIPKALTVSAFREKIVNLLDNAAIMANCARHQAALYDSAASNNLYASVLRRLENEGTTRQGVRTDPVDAPARKSSADVHAASKGDSLQADARPATDRVSERGATNRRQELLRKMLRNRPNQAKTPIRD